MLNEIFCCAIIVHYCILNEVSAPVNQFVCMASFYHLLHQSDINTGFNDM